MTTFHGTVLDSFGCQIGTGLELSEDGTLVEVINSDDDADHAADTYIIPGLVDIHCHGGGGASFPDNPTDESITAAIMTHRRMGTTALVASLVSMVDPVPVIVALVPWCERGELVGIHLEGPYISPHKVGAQNPAAVREPDLDELRTWLEAGQGYIRTMTIAPELPGAEEAAQLLLDYGALPSWGHTSATGEETVVQVRAAANYAASIGFNRPPQTATHLFNAMPPVLHRNPGPVRQLVASACAGQSVVELVADGVHVHPDLVHDVVSFIESSEAGPLGAIFVTDAMAGAGMPDGAYELGGLAVTITDGVAMLADGSSIAGSTARLADEIQRMVGGGHLTLPQAIRACVAGPARAIGLTDDTPGVTLTFRPGTRPNFVVLSSDYEVLTVVREGEAITE